MPERVETDDAIIQGWLNDARLISIYAAQAGVIKDNELNVSIGAVDQLAEKKLGAPEVEGLRLQLNKALESVPFSTLVALRNGWRPGDTKQSQKKLIFLLIFSVTIMVLAGHLSQIYNTGVSLLSEIRVLSVSHPDRRFGQLSRQLLAARKEIANSASKSGSLESQSLGLQAYFQVFDDLRELDLELSQISDRVEKYSDQASFPIIGSKLLLYYYYSFQRYLNIADSETLIWLQKQHPTPLSSQTSAKNSTTSIGAVPVSALAQPVVAVLSELGLYDQSPFCAQKIDAEKLIKDQVRFIDNVMHYDYFANVAKEYFYANIYNNCFESIKYGPSYIPSMDDFSSSVSSLIAPYAMWILPGLYGAIGATIFYLRMILDPLVPDPSKSRIFHRIVLGALSGMVLAWFWVPDTRFGTDLANIGFSLFALCFIFGFSLDVFFAMLDRFVKVSVGAIGQMGADQAKA
ncbi:hypothetical protein [Mesorhizobium shangrilense]|uniref:Uncharacterized protein n=1 Tax=Mesorhizobium shangrilense TaxID=460060 RepID=A0ABV2DKN6_9HYPH